MIFQRCPSYPNPADSICSQYSSKVQCSRGRIWKAFEKIEEQYWEILRKHTEIITEIYPLENPDFEVRKLNVYSTMSAMWTLNRMSTCIFLGKNQPTMLEKAVLVYVFFSRDDIYFSVREAVFLGNLIFPSFSDRKMGEGPSQG